MPGKLNIEKVFELRVFDTYGENFISTFLPSEEQAEWIVEQLEKKYSDLNSEIIEQNIENEKESALKNIEELIDDDYELNENYHEKE